MKELKAYPLIKSVSVVSFFTFISRCLGMIRDVLIFNFFGGTSLTVSAFYIAFTIPNLFRRLFGEGALSASFIPIFVKTKNENGIEAAWKLNQKNWNTITHYSIVHYDNRNIHIHSIIKY